MNLNITAYLKRGIMVLFLGCSLAMSKPTQVMRVTLADGSSQRILVEQISKITFKADKNDRTGITGLYVADRHLENKISWCSQQELLHILASQSGSAEITVYDLNGLRVAKKGVFVSAGQNMVSLASYQLKNGIYVVRIRKDGVIYSKHLNLVK